MFVEQVISVHLVQLFPIQNHLKEIIALQEAIVLEEIQDLFFAQQELINHQKAKTLAMNVQQVLSVLELAPLTLQLAQLEHIALSALQLLLYALQVHLILTQDLKKNLIASHVQLVITVLQELLLRQDNARLATIALQVHLLQTTQRQD